VSTSDGSGWQRYAGSDKSIAVRTVRTFQRRTTGRAARGATNDANLFAQKSRAALFRRRRSLGNCGMRAACAGSASGLRGRRASSLASRRNLHLAPLSGQLRDVYAANLFVQYATKTDLGLSQLADRNSASQAGQTAKPRNILRSRLTVGLIVLGVVVLSRWITDHGSCLPPMSHWR
jgi:hypothetical protein